MEKKITVDDLLDLGRVSGDYYMPHGSFKVPYYIIDYKLGDLIGHHGTSGRDKRPWYKKWFSSKKEAEKAAKSDAYNCLRKNLEGMLKDLSKEYTVEIEELRAYKNGKPQNPIKISKYDWGYTTRFYVRGNPNYIEIQSARVKEEGEHFTVDYENMTHCLGKLHSNGVYKHTFHNKEDAHAKALRLLKTTTRLLFASHGMNTSNLEFIVLKK